MTPEQLRAKINTEGWDEEFVDSAIELSQHGESDTPINNLRLEEEVLRNDDDTIRIVYCYQRLLDEDGIPGIYCTILHDRVPEMYAKHQLLDYSHGKYPFVVSTYEKTSKRLYHSRSVSELGAGPQNVLKIEEDASIDRQSLATMPPLEHPLGRAPSKWGPGVRIPYRTPGEYRFADTPRYDGGSMEVRRYVKEQLDRYIGRNAPGVDRVEAQMKQQRNIDKVFQHLKYVIDQVNFVY